jgi:hypothetical protein
MTTKREGMGGRAETPRSEHQWVGKRLEAYISGRLKAGDVERLEAHVHECHECSEKLDTLYLGAGVRDLFSEVRPGPDLEERAVVAFRTAPRRQSISRGQQRVLMVVAATLLVGAFGALTMNGLESRPTQTFSFVGSNIAGGDLAPRKSRVLNDSLADSRESEALGLQTPGAGAAITDGTGSIKVPESTPSQPPPGQPPVIGGGFGGGLGKGGWGTVPNHNLGLQLPGQPGGMDTYLYMPPQSSRGAVDSKTGPSTYGYTPGLSTTVPPGADSNFYKAFDPAKLRPADPSTLPGLPTGVTAPPPPPLAEPATPAPPGERGEKDSKFTKELPKEGTTAPVPEPGRRVVIRSGDIDFEIDSYDAASATVTKLITDIKGAFIAGANSEKLANGKVRGSITVRVPPEHLDSLVLDLRRELGKTGELKGVRITSQDVTKQYTDLESRLRGARTMEQRLIQIIKEGKGEIKQLLEAEKELGVWRTRIEEFEGELRYYSNLAALSTLTITLLEKQAAAAATVTESERVQAGVEVEDVDKAYQDLLAAIVAAKGRLTRSEVKQFAAGQYNATINFEVAPDASGPLRDRLRQLGHIARLEIDRTQKTDGPVTADTKPKRGDSIFLVQIYNLANIAPRETVNLQVAAADVSLAYRTLREDVRKFGGRLVSSQLNEQDRANVTGQIDFEVKRPDEGKAHAALDTVGEVISRQATRAPESESVTDTKVLHRVSIIALARIKPRETKTLQLAAADVATAYRSIREALNKTKARVIAAQLNEQDRQNVTAQLDFEIPITDEQVFETSREAAGEVISLQVVRTPENEITTDKKALYHLNFSSASKLKPRETTTLTIEVPKVEDAEQQLGDQVRAVKGRQLTATSSQEASGKTTAKLSYEVPLESAASVVSNFRRTGTVHVFQTSSDPQAPTGKFATARLDVTLTNAEGIVAADDGLWPQVRKGLTYSVSALLKSVTWVIFGLCVLLPWALIGLVGYRVVRRVVSPPAPAVPATPVAVPVVTPTVVPPATPVSLVSPLSPPEA